MAMNICHIVSGDLWAGAACQVSNLLSELVRYEHIHVSAITFNEGRLTEELLQLRIPVRCLPECRLSPLAILSGICRHIREFEVDVLHCHGHKEHILGCLAIMLTRPNAKVVRTLHGMPEPYYGLAGLKAKAIGRLQDLFFAYLTDIVIVVSRDMQQRFALKDWSKKTVCVHNGIDVDRVKPASSPAKMRKSMNIGDDEYILGAACRLVPVKRIDFLLEAFGIINRRYPRTLLLICGKGPLRLQLEKQSENLGVSARVRFLGHRDDMYNIMSILDLFIMTSQHEGIPMALLEAMALGIPVIAPAVGGIPEIVADTDATLFDPLDLKSLVERISNNIGSRTTTAKGSNDRRKNFPFSARNTALETIKVYEGMCRIKGRGRKSQAYGLCSAKFARDKSKMD